MIKILGRQSQILRGDFTFVPNEAGATPAWRVSASFAEEFDRARQAAYDDKPAPDAAAPAVK